MKHISKQSIIQICILAVIGLVSFTVINIVLGNLRERYVTNVIENRFDFITNAISTGTEMSIAEASLFAPLPSVSQAYEIALSGDINDPYSPQSQEARELLRKELAPMLDSYRDFIGESLQLHFHLPNGFSLVRLWREKNAMVDDVWVDISDDISSYRPTVMDTLRTGQITSGIEVGSGGFAIRGVIPVFSSDGRQIGSAEVLQSFDQVLRAAADEGGLFISLYANVELLDFSVELRDPELHPPKGDFIRVTDATDVSVESLITAELLARGKNGVYFERKGSMTLALYPISDYRGNQVGVIVLAMDTSDISLLINATTIALALMLLSMILIPIFMRLFRLRIREVEVRRQSAEDANRAKSTFLSTMSHEIRTPLNAVMGITEIQLQNDLLNTGVRDAFEKIYTSSDLLLGIINDILDLSKIEAGKFELLSGAYETASLFNNTAQLNIMRIGSKPIEFELEIDENMPARMIGDELRVKQILNNLLSNAFKYTAEGTVNLAATTEPGACDGDGITLVVRVSDTGQGMSREQVSRLFDEYSQFNQESNRNTEGTGLGMSITKELLKLMNGEIFVESEPGKGSVFTVRIPQSSVGPEVLGKSIAENLRRFRSDGRAYLKRVQITREPMPYGSVLVVDDVETNIYVARGLMTPYALSIDSADSGLAAIEKIKDGKVYDIVFMDHMMPQMDGIEATSIMRGMGYDHPIVALTANAVAGQADLLLSSGFDDFLSKPIDIRRLNAVLNKLIRDKQPPDILEAARRQAEVMKDLGQEGASPQSIIDSKIAEVFVRDAGKSLAMLGKILEDGCPCDGDARMYVIYMHGLKSALANVGNAALSAVAYRLEQAGRDGDIEIVASETPAFLDSLRVFVAELSEKHKKPIGEAVSAGDEDKQLLRKYLLTIKESCEAFDETAAEDAFLELDRYQWSDQTKKLLEQISGLLLHFDFDDIAVIVDEHLEK